MVSNKAARLHLELLNARLSGNALRLGLYLYGETYLANKSKTRPLNKEALANALQCSESSIKDSLKKLREAGMVRLTDAEIQSHYVEYSLNLPRPPFRLRPNPQKKAQLQRRNLRSKKFVRKLNIWR